VLGWLFRFLIAFVAARLVAGALRQRRTEPTPFDPVRGPERAKPRGDGPFGADPVEDADYEELPRRK
jgi:hypothetical protein